MPLQFNTVYAENRKVLEHLRRVQDLPSDVIIDAPHRTSVEKKRAYCNLTVLEGAIGRALADPNSSETRSYLEKAMAELRKPQEEHIQQQQKLHDRLLEMMADNQSLMERHQQDLQKMQGLESEIQSLKQELRNASKPKAKTAKPAKEKTAKEKPEKMHEAKPHHNPGELPLVGKFFPGDVLVHGWRHWLIVEVSVKHIANMKCFTYNPTNGKLLILDTEYTGQLLTSSQKNKMWDQIPTCSPLTSVKLLTEEEVAKIQSPEFLKVIAEVRKVHNWKLNPALASV